MSSNVAELLVEKLIQNGIDQLYCLPGVQNDDFFNALYDRQNELSPIQTRHEQGAAYMALGAALATGKPQAFCVVPGPGFLNACAALSTAYALNAPLLAIVGQIPSGAVGKGFGLLHEIPDQFSILNGLTKHSETIADGKDARRQLETAFTALASGRPRPVGIEIPVNVWKSPVDQVAVSAPAPIAEIATIDPAQIDAAAQLLTNAQRPMIVVGSGALSCGTEVKRLAEMLTAPVVAYRTGHGILPRDHDLSIANPVAHDLWRTCDVVLGLGTRLNQQMIWGTDDAMKIIHIEVDNEELGRVRQPDLGIQADIHDALPSLVASLEQHQIAPRNDWRATVLSTKERFAKLFADKVGPQIEWLDAIRDELPRDGIFVDELTQIGYVARFAFPSYEPRTYLSPGYQGTLGWGIPAALGAAHARRDVPVVSISGDGGALFAISELATAAIHDIPLTCIILNDNAFGNVKRFQIENYNNRTIASDLQSPDFVKLAESFGVKGIRAETPDELRQQLRQSVNSKAPTVVEIPVGDFPSPWEFIMMPKVRGI